MNQPLSPAGYTAISAIDQPAPLVCLHCAIMPGGGRVLSSEHFRLVRFSGQENSSEPFDYKLELHGDTDPACDALAFEDVIGCPVTVGVHYPAPQPQPPQPSSGLGMAEQLQQRFSAALQGQDPGDALALYNGIVASFAMEQPGVYRITMKPALHRLTLTNNYTVYPGMSVRAVIAALLERQRIAYSLDALDQPDDLGVARVQDWLQAGESDYDFLRRLMGKAQLYFFFAHHGNRHILVFANRPAYPPVFADDHPLRYTWCAADQLGLAQSDVIYQYQYQRSLTSSSVCGVFTRQHACWEDDAIAAPASYRAASDQEAGELPFNQYKIVQYGGSSAEVERHVRNTSASMAAAAQVLAGASYCAHLRPGHQFSVSGAVAIPGYPNPVRPALDGQRFVVTQVQFEADADGLYRNQFQAAPVTGLISGYSMQETQQGSLLAEVVAKPGLPVQDWRYYTAAYFDPTSTSLSDRVQPQGPPALLQAQGVWVRFSSAPADAAPVFIKLAPHMQTVPEPGVTVLVSRAQDETELPEIQSIIHNNGTRLIQPSGWGASSHVGSNYATSYGDSKSIRYGLHSRADLDQAEERVGTPYASGRFRETSYAQGATYSLSCSESRAHSASDEDELFGGAPATDLLSASESFGSTYSRHRGEVVYSFSHIGRSQTLSHVSGRSSNTAVHDGDVSSSTTVNADQSNDNTVLGTNSSSSFSTMQDNSNTVLVSTSMDFTGTSMRTSLSGAGVETSISGSHTSMQIMAQSNTIQLIEEQNEVKDVGPGVSIDLRAGTVEANTKDLSVTAIVMLQIFL